MAVACAIACGVFVAGAWLPAGAQLEYTPDSLEYKAIAENLWSGRGYRNENSEIAVNRSPLYPAVLALLFHQDQILLDSRIAALHRCLAFVIGLSLFLYGNATFGRLGAVCATLACILISGDDELGYAAVQVLSELPATAFLCLSLWAMRWTSQGSARREVLMAMLQIGLFMTRSALVFCGVSYGIYLVCRLCRKRSAENLQRVVLFGIPCGLSICAWSWFLWAQTSQVVLLTSTGLSNMAAGLSPEVVTASQKWAVPHTDRQLEDFWTGAPAVSADVAAAAARKAVHEPVETMRLIAAKFRIAFNRMPLGAFYLGMSGVALQLCSHLREATSANCSRVRQVVGRGAHGMAFCICSLALCGFSLTALKVGVVVAAIAVVMCRVSPIGVPYKSRDDGDPVPPAIAMVYGGFFLMTLVSFGLPRFTRPFLPAIYLSATLCLPLACRLWSQQAKPLSIDTP